MGDGKGFYVKTVERDICVIMVIFVRRVREERGGLVVCVGHWEWFDIFKCYFLCV